MQPGQIIVLILASLLASIFLGFTLRYRDEVLEGYTDLIQFNVDDNEDHSGGYLLGTIIGILTYVAIAVACLLLFVVSVSPSKC